MHTFEINVKGLLVVNQKMLKPAFPIMQLNKNLSFTPSLAEDCRHLSKVSSPRPEITLMITPVYNCYMDLKSVL